MTHAQCTHGCGCGKPKVRYVRSRLAAEVDRTSFLPEAEKDCAAISKIGAVVVVDREECAEFEGREMMPLPARARAEIWVFGLLAPLAGSVALSAEEPEGVRVCPC